MLVKELGLILASELWPTYEKLWLMLILGEVIVDKRLSSLSHY